MANSNANLLSTIQPHIQQAHGMHGQQHPPHIGNGGLSQDQTAHPRRSMRLAGAEVRHVSLPPSRSRALRRTLEVSPTVAYEVPTPPGMALKIRPLPQAANPVRVSQPIPFNSVNDENVSDVNKASLKVPLVGKVQSSTSVTVNAASDTDLLNMGDRQYSDQPGGPGSHMPIRQTHFDNKGGSKSSTRFDDWISDDEWRNTMRSSDQLSAAWRDEGNLAFDERNDSHAVSTVLRKWEEFCYAKWTSPSEAVAVRAFMGCAITPKLSDEIKKAFGRHSLSRANLRSRYFYTELYDFITSYLGDYYTNSVYVTGILQKILTLQQRDQSLNEHLRQVEDLIEELRFCSASRSVQLDVDHLSNALQLSLSDPFRSWYYDEAQQMAREGRFGTFDVLFEICQRLKRKARTLGRECPSTTSLAMVSTTRLDSREATKSATNQQQTANSKPSFQGCKRCYSKDHKVDSCDATTPRSISVR
ncbi:hypothetical protein FOL47_010100, partial [Perkinsus chesapeaki]